MDYQTIPKNHRLPGEFWVFAYGSLIWNPGFKYTQRKKACLRNWARRFWQASTDHRGNPEAPGRVLTLVPHEGATCEGIAYQIHGNIEATLSYLDHRERGGYQRQVLPVEITGPPGETRDMLVYIGDSQHPLFTGPTPIGDISRILTRSHGESGSNLDYYRELATALHRENISDPHITHIARNLPA
ncbi:MAG: gamma-glutamylcyclotransferase [Gammaproteobacteria bacterium]